MLKIVEKRIKLRKKRQLRVRKKLRGDAERPRMTVSKTNRHIFVQVIDDVEQKTLVSFGTQSKGEKSKKSKESAKLVGQKIAELAKDANIEKVVFDRGRHKYHGLIAGLVDAARESGLQV
jgi:large subunit ribosomal protein L18